MEKFFLLKSPALSQMHKDWVKTPLCSCFRRGLSRIKHFWMSSLGKTKCCKKVKEVSKRKEDKQPQSLCMTGQTSNPTLFVGDKNIRSVRHKSNITHGWTTEVPGDMHAIGYLCEVCYKSQGPGGFAYILQNQLKREKATADTFKDKKFQGQNLSRIKEAVPDVAFGYGLATVKGFAASSKFPSETELRKCMRQTGNHNRVIVEQFQDWLHECSQGDTNFSYHAEMIVLFGPLQELYLDAIHHNLGVARETVCMLLLPLASQLQNSTTGWSH